MREARRVAVERLDMGVLPPKDNVTHELDEKIRELRKRAFGYDGVGNMEKAGIKRTINLSQTWVWCHSNTLASGKLSIVIVAPRGRWAGPIGRRAHEKNVWNGHMDSIGDVSE